MDPILGNNTLRLHGSTNCLLCMLIPGGVWGSAEDLEKAKSSICLTDIANPYVVAMITYDAAVLNCKINVLLCNHYKPSIAYM